MALWWVVVRPKSVVKNVRMPPKCLHLEHLDQFQIR